MAAARDDLHGLRLAAARLASDLRGTRGPLDDRAFDRFLSASLQEVSDQYWSPLAVAKRAAKWLDEAGVQRVADIGSGAGKFCVAAAVFGRCEFVGLEHRAFLVNAARHLARVFAVQHRVRFVRGALGAARLPVADAYYLFNPFGEYRFTRQPLMDAGLALDCQRRTDDIATAEHLLRRAPAGTWLLTYNGFGGRVPGEYRLIRVDRILRSSLRLWRKERDG